MVFRYFEILNLTQGPEVNHLYIYKYFISTTQFGHTHIKDPTKSGRKYIRFTTGDGGKHGTKLIYRYLYVYTALKLQVLGYACQTCIFIGIPNTEKTAYNLLHNI